MQCPRCEGSGICIECQGRGISECPFCKGLGSNTNALASGVIVETKCSRCAGEGFISCPENCDICRGKGIFEPKEDFIQKRDNNLTEVIFKPFVPKVTYTILILIVLATALSGVLSDRKGNLFYLLGFFYAPYIEQGQIWRFITAMFLHGNLLHLLSNVYCLFILSPMIEHVAGWKRFLTLYFLSGIAGFVLSMIFVPQHPTVGASGALFGIMTSYLGLQLRNGIFEKHVVHQLLFWFFINLFLGFSMPMINVWAHIGGALAGFVYAYFMKLEK